MSDESEKKQDDAPESTDAKAPAKNPPAKKEKKKDVTVVKDGDVTVQPALLEEAVTQLKKLSEMRQQELVRQDNAIAEMQATVQTQARQNRTLLNSIGALICILILLVSYSIQALKSEQESTTKEVHSVVTRLSTTANMIRQVSVKQSDQTETGLSDSFSDATTSMNAKLDDSVSQIDKSMTKLDGTVGKVTESVEASVAEIESTLQATTGELVTKMDARSSDMTKTLNSSVDAMRGERDIVKAEVQKAMNAHREHIVERELALSKKAENVAKQEEQTRKDRIKIIDDAIHRLSSMANTLKTPEDLAKEDAEAKKAIADAVKKAKAEEAKKAKVGKTSPKETASKKQQAKNQDAPAKKDDPAKKTDAEKAPDDTKAPADTNANAKTAG